MFRQESDARLPFFVNDRFRAFSGKGWALSHRLKGLGVTCHDKDIWYLTMADINDLDRMITVGLDPRAVSKERLYEVLNIGANDRAGDVYAKSTFDALVARGFALDEADLIVLDERVEPALKDYLSARIIEER